MFMTKKTPEFYVHQGAQAMRDQAAALALQAGQNALAQQILAAPVPVPVDLHQQLYRQDVPAPAPHS